MMPGDLFFSADNWLIWLAILWSLPWKGWALWRASRKNDRVWFIVLFLVNTVGLLDMVYLFFISERRRTPASRKGATGGMA